MFDTSTEAACLKLIFTKFACSGKSACMPYRCIPHTFTKSTGNASSSLHSMFTRD